MKMVLNPLTKAFEQQLQNPTQGAPIPELVRGSGVGDFAQDAITQWVLDRLHDLGQWVQDYGLFIGSELALCVSLVFFLFAIAGKGPWMERGAKWFVASILLGVTANAV